MAGLLKRLGLKKRAAAILMAVALAFAGISGGALTAYAATGDTPPHTKSLTDNHDGTYTLSLDVVGDSEKKPNNINVIVIVDTSGSMTQQRMTAAKNAVNSLANSLYAYNTQSDPNTVEMALVRFATSSSVARTPTNNATQFTNAVNGLGNQGNGGTNWESALQTAYGVDFGDNDQTFAIFVSDGNPTFRTTQNGWNDWSYQYQQWGSGQETTENIRRCYTTAVDDAQALATKVTPGNFFTIGAFGNVDRMEQLTDDAGSDSSTNYYNASNTAALNQAISDILAKIEMAGIAKAGIEDGTTNQVTTSSGDVAELLEVDTSSYKYYRTGGSYGTMQPWSDAPAAQFTDGKVDWDLSSVGVLENGVRYTVTFDVYPSQYTYDTIAKLKNGDITYDSLDANVKKYIVDGGNGNYSLRTNTNATLSYDDTRDDAGQQTADYVNPNPVATDAATMSVTKEWKNALDARTVGSIDMTVLMGNADFHKVTLNDPSWTAENIYISPGIIKGGQVLPGAEGHDFTFAELGSEQYNWELVAPVVHPMLIDGTLTMLTMVDAAHPVPSGAQTYTINGKTYYSNGSSSASLDAYNYRRSNLNLMKIVDGEDAPADATFPFTLTVNNSKASTGSESDTSSDHYVWFSIYDTKAGATVKDATVTGATAEAGDTGYYYAPSGTAVTVQMKAGWNLRFTNLPTGTTYTFAEGELPSGFAFNKSELTSGEDSTFTAGKTTTGTVEDTNTSYQVNFTNNYQLTNLEITKVWDDANNQDGKRVAAEDFAELLTLSPAVEGATPTVTDNGDNTYTIKYTDLPRFDNGAEVEYKVTESAIDGYTTTGSPAEDHGTITNKHEIDKTKVTVTKAWNDNKNADKTRPESVSVTLSADGTAVGDAVTLNEANNWTYTWENLDVNAAGKAITYTVDEAEVPGYAKSISAISGDATTGYRYTITNSNVTVDASTTAFFKKNVTTPNTIKAADFSFSIEAVTDGAPMPASTTGTASYEAGKTGEKAINFGKITYTAAGEYKYKITETNKPAGWTATPDKPVEVTVTVTGDAATGFKAEVTGATIENAYSVQPTTASFPVKKILSVAEGLTAPDITGKYTFTLTAADGTPMPEVKSYTNPDKDGGSVTFGKIEYTAAGTYTYTVTETGTVDGITNDSAAEAGKTVTVTVVDNGDGTLTATPSTDETPVSFTNTYEVGQVTASIPVEKTVTVPEGLTGPTDWKYTITAAAVDGAPEAESMTAEVTKASPSASIGEFTFTKPGTYKYTVTESGENDGITNGTASYDIEIVVTDNSDGTLTAVVNGGKAVAFENAYSVEPTTVSFPVEKELVVPEDLEGPAEWSYTIDVTANDGAPVAETMTGTVNQDTTSLTFGDFTYDKPGTYTYTVSETGTVAGVTNDAEAAGKTVTVTVVDNGDGTLTATANSTTDEPLTFTNTYGVEPVEASFPVEKVLSVPEGVTGPAEWSYDITVSGTPAAETMTGKVDQTNSTATFGPFKYTEPGTYTYTVSETGTVAGVTNDADAAGKTVTVTVVDNGDGSLTATASSTTDEPLTFTNTYSAKGTVTPVATKVAEGFDLKAEQFTFQLKDANGELVSEAKNAADGSITFDEIEHTAAGEYTYTINEVVVDEDGIADDTHVCDVTVTVVDNGDGSLTATAEYSDNKFVNKHTDNKKDVVSAKDTKTSVDGELVEAGDTLTYTISYANNTDGVAKVTVTDTIPTNTTYVEGSASDGGVFADGTITWTIEGVEPGATGTVTFQVTVNEAAAGTTIENTGKVNDGENDSSTNAVTTSVPVKDVQDESGASIDGEGVQVGDTLTYEVGFTLTEDATSVVVTDDVPANTTLVDGSISEGGSLSGNTITWDLGALPAGDYTVSFKVTVDESAVTVDAITNTANISVNNHSDVHTNTVTNTAEKGGLTVSKTVTVPEGFEIDEDAAFTFTVKLTDKNDKALEGEYKYTGSAEGTIANGGTVTLKHGESITIAGLPAGAKYEISEAAVDGYTPDQATITGEISADETASATAAFVNAYNVKPTTIELGASKTLKVEDPANNPPDVSGKYTFTIAAASEGAPLPENTSVTNPDGEGTAVNFDKISYTKPGEYQYTITESGEVAGVTNGQTSYTVVVKVSDNGDGTLTAKVSKGEQVTAFTNTYKVTPVTLEKGFEVTKDLTGTPLTAGAFEFELKADEGIPMPAQTKVTNDADGKVTFGSITYTEPGTYNYTISEINGGKGGYTYDGDTVGVTVTVTDNGEGKLVAEVAYDGETTFNNTYEASGEIPLSVAKKLTGHALAEGQFTFELLDEDGNVIQTKTNNDTGAVQFDPIAYSEKDFDTESKDADNKEKAAEEESASEDAAPVESEAEDAAVAESEEANSEAEAGAEEAESTANGEDATADASESATSGEAEPEPTADVEAEDAAVEAESSDAEGLNVNVAEKFAKPTVFLAPVLAQVENNDEVVDAVADAVLGEEATEEDEVVAAADESTDDVAAKADGDEEKNGRTKTFTYTIHEVAGSAAGYGYDTHEVTVKVTIEDNGEGKIIATAEYEGATTFTNTYEAEGSAQFNGTKAVTGTDLKDGQFTFQLKDAKGNVLQEVKNAADGSFAFEPVTYKQNAEQQDADTGTFKYTIVEINDGQLGYTYDSHVCDVTVTVTDNNDGTLSTEVEYGDGEAASFNNPYKPLATSIPLKATKVLEGRDLKSGEFTFELFDSNGNKIATANNSANGTVNFGDILFEDPGTYEFTASEIEGDDENMTYDTSVKSYTVEVVDKDGQLVATVTNEGEQEFVNTYEPDEPDNPGHNNPPHRNPPAHLPSTGDAAPIIAILIVALASAAVLVGAARRRAMKR